jgi:probable F420-dependent oxidoreductase
MKLGLFGVNMGACADPGVLVSVAKAAEQAGFESVWAGEHVVVPDPQAPPSPMAPHDPALDPLLALTLAASATTSLRIATGIVILPQRNPLVLAKQIASLDVLSAGRFMFGVGVGYLEPEFRAIGANFDQRGAVTDDYLTAMEALWYFERPVHQGPFASFEGVNAYPRPVQSRIPIIVGGRSPAAFRRAVGRGAGWYGFFLTPEETSIAVSGLRQAADQVERPSELGPLELSVTPRRQLSPEVVAEFADTGVTRLVPMPAPTAGRDDIMALIDTAATVVAAP